MPKAPAGEAGSRCDDASRRHQHCCKNAFHDRYSSFCAAPRRHSCNHPWATTFDLPCFALTALAFIRTSNRAMDEAHEQAARRAKALIGKIDLAARGQPTRECKPAAKRMQILSRGQKRSLAPEIVSSRCSRTRNSTGT